MKKGEPKSGRNFWEKLGRLKTLLLVYLNLKKKKKFLRKRNSSVIVLLVCCYLTGCELGWLFQI